ncbi:hypothetical protein J6590_051394 [Homalodisca vitripennis]|nr:hypothetical protein J6590_051394 [Homalodisca vitripennis]
MVLQGLVRAEALTFKPKTEPRRFQPRWIRWSVKLRKGHDHRIAYRNMTFDGEYGSRERKFPSLDNRIDTRYPSDGFLTVTKLKPIPVLDTEGSRVKPCSEDRRLRSSSWTSARNTSQERHITNCKFQDSGAHGQFDRSSLLWEMTVGVGGICSITSEVLASNKGVLPPACFDWRGWFRAGLPFFREDMTLRLVP